MEEEDTHSLFRENKNREIIPDENIAKIKTKRKILIFKIAKISAFKVTIGTSEQGMKNVQSL